MARETLSSTFVPHHPRLVFRTLPRALRALLFKFAFGLCITGAVAIGVVIVPSMRFLTRRPTDLLTREIIARAVRFYLYLLQSTNLLKLDVRGLERVPSEPVVFVANHPSLLDALVFLAYFPKCVCIAKDDLSRFSPFAPLVRHGNYIVNRAPNQLLEQAKSELCRGYSVLIFPEGTRTQDRKSQEWKFHRGAATIALRSGFPLVPVFISCSPPFLGRTADGALIPDRTCHMQLDFFSPQDRVAQLPTDGTPWLATRRITAELEKLYQLHEQGTTSCAVEECC